MTAGAVTTPLPGPLVAEMVQGFGAWLTASHRAPGTVQARTKALERFVAWCTMDGTAHADGLTLPVLERYRSAVFGRRKANGLPLTAATQGLQLLAVKQCLRWATRMGLLAEDHGAALELPRATRRLPCDVLTAAEVERVLALPDLRTDLGLRDRAILETFYSTGVRRMELIGLALSSVDPARGVVTVRCGKGGRDRVVPIGERALGWIRRYVAEVRRRVQCLPGEDALFLTSRGRRLRANRLSDLVSRYVHRAKLGKAGSCHLFRHSMATLMLERGADVRLIQELLGHAELSTTQIYTHVSIAHLKAVHRRTHPAQGSGERSWFAPFEEPCATPLPGWMPDPAPFGDASLAGECAGRR